MACTLLNRPLLSLALPLSLVLLHMHPHTSVHMNIPMPSHPLLVLASELVWVSVSMVNLVAEYGDWVGGIALDFGVLLPAPSPHCQHWLP